MEKNMEFAERRGLLSGLPEELRAKILFALVPLRHFEWGANANNCYMTAYGWGAAATQATMFQTMDRLALAQYLSRIGLLLDGNTGESLQLGKALWIDHSAWQGVRRLVENMMATRDWVELFVAQNLVVDSLLHPLVFKHFVAEIDAASGVSLGLITEFMTSWYDETARWIDATVKTLTVESADNADRLRDWSSTWRARGKEALGPWTTELFGSDAHRVLAQVDQALTTRLSKLGLGTTEVVS
jgi:phenol hydroxylase P1 protein